MQLSRGQFPFVAQRGRLYPWQMVRVAGDSVSLGLGFDQISKVFQGQDAGNGLFVEDRKALHLVGGPSFGYPLDYPLRLLA